MVVLIVTNVITVAALVAAMFKIRRLQSDIKISQALEEQMWSFPKVSHDDVLDAVVSGILYFLDNSTPKVLTCINLKRTVCTLVQQYLNSADN
jgi:phage terminase large subunit-like protein